MRDLNLGLLSRRRAADRQDAECYLVKTQGALG